MRTIEASGLEALAHVSTLLNRIRLADPVGGIWEAADFQWWWRTPRASDTLDQRFWLDADGAVAAAPLTTWGTGWGLDPIVLPERRADLLETVVMESLARADADGRHSIESLVRDDDRELIELLVRAGFEETDDRGGDTWLDADQRPAIAPPAEGFTLVDRETTPDGPHPMIGRSGPEIERRLRQVPLYDPMLDLSVRTSSGDVAGYALFWFDPVTHVGLVEPMRVEDAWQRRGLARALLTDGLDRLARKGATRLKVGWGSPPGRALYLGAGFRELSTVTTFARKPR
jgi:GNAT superfamily N-acetyltransferase